MLRSRLWIPILVVFAILFLPRALTAQSQSQTQAPIAGTPAAISKTFRLEDGTPIKIRLQRTISSADAQVDERLDFDVLEEIKVNDVVVIPKGGVAWGTVTQAQPKRRMARGGKLAVNIDAVRLADGGKAALRGVKDVKGGGHTGAMTAGIVVTGLLVWPAAPFFLFMHGKDIVIPKGTELTVYINGDNNLDPAKFGAKPSAESAIAQEPAGAASLPAQPTAEPAVPASVASENSTTVVLKADPPGADVTVDGKYMGSTPSTVRLAPGDHTILLEKAGYKPWQRTLTVNPGGIVNIEAVLTKDMPENASTTSRKSVVNMEKVTVEPGITGSYDGEVRNQTLGVSAKYRIAVRDESGSVYGCTTVQRPLSGSGGFHGSINGSHIVFETVGKKHRIRFNGEFQGDEMKGNYTVLSTQEHGEFALKRTTSEAPSIGFDTAQCRKD